MKASEFWSNICFYGRCIKVVCQEWWRKIFAVALVAFACGCANLNERLSSPYACARSPYYCTAEAWTNCVCAPFKLGNSQDPIWTCFATLTWPFWIVDEIAEVALDTVFLPVDGIYEFCKDKPSDHQDQQEFIQDVTLSSTLCPAKSFTQNNHSSGCGERRVRKGGILTNN